MFQGMSRDGPCRPRRPRAEIDADTVLLVQAYLLARAERRPPDPQSTRAWEEFYAAYDPLIRHLAAAHPLPSVAPEDRVQEVWGAVLTRLPRLQFAPQRGRLGGWLTTLARHVLADLGRRAARHPLGHLGPAAEDRIPGREPEPALACDLGQVQQWVRSALGELRSQVSEAGYEVVYLRWIEGKRIAEIAAAQGIDTKRVRERHRRTVLKLRELLARRLARGETLAPDPARAIRIRSSEVPPGGRISPGAEILPESRASSRAEELYSLKEGRSDPEPFRPAALPWGAR